MKPDKGWQRRFRDPIPLPRGRQLVTLEDDGKFIMRLPKAEHAAAEWQAAMEALTVRYLLNGVSGGTRATWCLRSSKSCAKSPMAILLVVNRILSTRSCQAANRRMASG